MFNKNNLLLVGLAGASAAAVAVLSVGGYLLHRKALKYRLHEQARRQAMNLAFFDLASGEVTPDEYEHFDYNDYADDYEDEDEYLNGLFNNFDTEGNGE